MVDEILREYISFVSPTTTRINIFGFNGTRGI